MDLLSALTLAGVVLMSVTVLIALGTLLWRSAQSEARRIAGLSEIMGSLNRQEIHLETLNGSTAEVQRQANANTGRIERIEGAHDRPQG